jgi:gentisate 1,2-dioxygenase
MDADALRKSLADLNLEPLWERTEGGLRPAPLPDAPQIWRWAEIEPLIDETIAAVPMDKVERRVLTLRNPDPRRRYTTTTRSINCGLQVLMPGETAPPHRHSPNALRVALAGEGGRTTVNGETHEMIRGDVILTPSWTSHAHSHAGSERVVWIDFLDVPLFRDLELIFFEVGGAEPEAAVASVGGAHGGPLPAGRFPWADIRAALIAAASDGESVHDYVDPVIGDAALATLDCRARCFRPGNRLERERRTSANSVCLVLEGEGETDFGETVLRWRPNDIFTVPHWRWHAHRVEGDAPAVLMEVSDRPALRRLGVLSETERARRSAP